jgi:hypothetical protein
MGLVSLAGSSNPLLSHKALIIFQKILIFLPVIALVYTVKNFRILGNQAKKVSERSDTQLFFFGNRLENPLTLFEGAKMGFRALGNPFFHLRKPLMDF